ncbi:MAG: quinolinate synthase NadA [Oscillospiraceae bacterium]|nr:quinolinate synthase NadA [Oscillospiraceae bacterium]
MTVEQLQKMIAQAKKENDVCILAHSYQNREICEIADIVGDSFKLSVEAQKVQNSKIVMCGVHFMAETAKLLSPEKTVVIASDEAGCPMAEQFTPEEVLAFKAEHPDYKVVSYINTTAALKCVTDVCVTSSSAVEIVGKLPDKNILFIPDKNLGAFVKSAYPEKNIVCWNGGCPVHGAMTAADVKKIREKYPEAKFLVHPECPPEVCENADYIGSTAGIIAYARKSDAEQFIIGTEISITEQLSYEMPTKQFFNLSKRLICSDMKTTTLVDVYNAVCGKGGLEITFDEDTAAKARHCIDEMIRLGG